MTEIEKECSQVGEEDVNDSEQNPLKVCRESNEKVDSGMDDDSQQSNEQDGVDDDDDEPIVKKSSKKNLRILDDDDDDDDDDQNKNSTLHAEEISTTEKTTMSKGHLMTADQVLEEILNEESNSEEDNSDDSSDDISINQTVSSERKKKKKRVLKMLDEDSNDSVKEKSGDSVEDMETESSTPAPDKQDNMFANTDIFDAEDDESDDSNKDSGDDSGSDSSKEENDDEGFDESNIDPKLLKKLKQGAAKKPSRSSKQKSKRDELLQIHSETQRIVRESRVNLPYHQPEPKPLKDFLARANKKQQEYKMLRNVRDIHKAKAMQNLFEKSKVPMPTLTDPKSKGDDIQLNDSNNLPEQTQTGVEQDQDRETDKCSSQESESRENDDYMETDDLPDLDKPLHIRVSNSMASRPDKQKGEVESTATEELKSNSEIKETDEVTSVCEQNEGSNIHEIDGSEQSMSEPSVVTKESEEKPDTEEVPQISNIMCQDSEKISDSANSTDMKSKKLSLLSTNLPTLNALPKLSGDPESFISFEDSNDTPVNSGISKLMDRFVKHSKKKSKVHHKDVDISIVEKGKAGDSEELRMSTFTYHPTEEDENSLMALEAPGAKLMALKEKLQEKMKMRREESRKQRQDVYDLDNEEGGYGGEEDEILDDEAEMSDKSDTDIEDDEFDEQFGEEEEIEEANPFADDEAEEEEDDNDDDLKDDDDNDEMNLRLDLSDDEEDEKGDENNAVRESQKQSAKKKKIKALYISDDEESRGGAQEGGHVEERGESLTEEEDKENCEPRPIPPLQPPASILHESTDDDTFTPFSKHLSTISQIQESKKGSSLSLPVEDSQDLYGVTQNVPVMDTQTQQSQKFNFFLEESQSQMLDADGFLKIGSTGKKVSKPVDFSACAPASQENMDELLGLCSGKFAATQDEERKGSCKNLFGDAFQTQGNMDELLGLCSGKFMDNGTQREPQQRSGVKRKSPFEEDEENSNESFKLVSDEEDVQSTKDALSESEASDEDEDGHAESSRGSSEVKVEKFKGFTVRNQHGKILKEFVDEEAELSGSEYDSDENLDVAEEDDVLEMEEGDKDVVATEEELRNQVGRAHLKQLIDEDKRELMRFQEMYLPDGDLHSEGGGRARRFRWNNMDDDTQQDMFNNNSDEENMEEDEQDVEWRKKRFERERFLQEQQEADTADEENSAFLKFGKVFFKRSNSDSGALKKLDSDSQLGKQTTANSSATLLKMPMQRRGSFLGRDKETLAKIAQTTKSVVNPTGPRNSRNFVFQVLSPEKDSNTEAMPAPVEVKVRKAHKPKPQQPAAKKPKLDRSESFSQSSIFNHL